MEHHTTMVNLGRMGGWEGRMGGRGDLEGVVRLGVRSCMRGLCIERVDILEGAI